MSSIYLVSDSFPPVPSGVSKYTFFLARELLKRGHNVKVITGGVRITPEEDKKIREYGGEVMRFGKLVSVTANGTRCWITLLSPKDLVRLRAEFKKPHDIVIMQGPGGLTLPYPATLLSKAKKIGIFHSVTEKPNLGYILFRYIIRPFLSSLDVMIAVSRWAKMEVEKYFGPQNMVIIPPGIDTSIYNERAGKKQPEKVRFVFLGRLDERKGVDILVSAWQKIKNKAGKKNGKYVPLELVIGGDGPMRKKIEKMVGSDENVKIAGLIPEERLPEFYASADISVFPSVGGESFGIVIIESMACGTPPIASNIKGYCDLVDGENGLLFRGENELISAINRLAQDEEMRKRMGEKARRYAKNYDWNTIADKIENIIRNL